MLKIYLSNRNKNRENNVKNLLNQILLEYSNFLPTFLEEIYITDGGRLRSYINGAEINTICLDTRDPKLFLLNEYLRLEFDNYIHTIISLDVINKLKFYFSKEYELNEYIKKEYSEYNYYKNILILTNVFKLLQELIGKKGIEKLYINAERKSISLEKFILNNFKEILNVFKKLGFLYEKTKNSLTVESLTNT